MLCDGGSADASSMVSGSASHVGGACAPPIRTTGGKYLSPPTRNQHDPNTDKPAASGNGAHSTAKSSAAWVRALAKAIAESFAVGNRPALVPRSARMRRIAMQKTQPSAARIFGPLRKTYISMLCAMSGRRARNSALDMRGMRSRASGALSRPSW